MIKTNPQYRRPLNSYQIQILQILYKFHFATAHLIVKNQSSKYQHVILERLKILADQGYIGQNYDSSYKITGKPATYYLELEAIRYLKQQPFASQRAINSIYADKRAGEAYISHCLNIFAIYIEFKRLQPDAFNFYSKNELANKQNMPKYLPDAYLGRKTNNQPQANDYLLDYYEEATHYFLLRRKIKSYIDYAESEVWQKNINSQLPTILMVCETKKLQKRMIRIALRELNTAWVDLTFLTITKEELAKDSSDIPKWIRISDENELVLL